MTVQVTKREARNMPVIAKADMMTDAEQLRLRQQVASYGIENLNRKLARAHEIIEEWRQKLPSDPVYGFDWSDDVVEAAARVKILTGLLTLEPEMQIEDPLGYLAQIREIAADEALRAASGAHGTSSSDGRNMMRKAQTKVWADLARGQLY